MLRTSRTPNRPHSLQIPNVQIPGTASEVASGTVREKQEKAIAHAVGRAMKAGVKVDGKLLYRKPGPAEREILIEAENEARRMAGETGDQEWFQAARGIRAIHQSYATK